MILTPRIEGTVAIQSSADQFARAFERRVTSGLLGGERHSRSKYRIVETKPDFIRVQAVDWLTAFNVGLNDVELRVRPGSVRYRVRYWRWAWYAITLGGILGGIGVVLLTAFDARSYIADHPRSMLPGLSVDQSVLVAWAMAIFWGFIWPWVLIALHKRPLHELVARLIGEVDAAR